MSASVEYVEIPEPFDVGCYDETSIMFFGHYRVTLDDGFTYLSPHTGFAGTVSQDPIPLDAVSIGEQSTYGDLLIEAAVRCRDAALDPSADTP